MKKNVLFFILSFWTFFIAKGQVIHSSNAMEYSLGMEHFSQFVAQTAESRLIGGENLIKPETYRWRPSLNARYKKFLNSGNYFGFGFQVAYSSWEEEILATGISEFDLVGIPTDILIFELNTETKFGGSYQYSFLINKEKDSNFQFFIGGIADLYTSFANKDEMDFFFFPFLRRNIIGGRISAMPEITYLVPDSRMTVSLRGIIPIADLQRVSESLRHSFISSSFSTRVLSSNFKLAPILRSRFEIGFGYFLKSI